MKNKSDHFDGQLFFNPTGQADKKFADFLKWRNSKQRKPWPKWRENSATPEILAKVANGIAALTFVNHATMLIQLSGLNILTDPVWSKRVSPFQNLGPARVRAPGVSLESLPKIDVVLISHNHYDHMDKVTIQKLEKRHSPLFLVALGDKKIVQGFGAKHVQELDWWDRIDHGDCQFSFVPARHWSGRGIRDRRKSLWGGFVINRGDKQIYFAGDAAYSTHFNEIAAQFRNIRIALLPIGAYEPRWFMKDSHMNPEEAVQAHKDLKANASIGIHFGTFQLTDEGIDDPLLHLNEARQKHQVSVEKFMTLSEGETKIFDF